MSTGFTGLIFRIYAERTGRCVDIIFDGAYDTEDNITTTRTAIANSFKFRTVWRAELYSQRINKGQYHRYANTAVNCGFKKTNGG